MLRTFLRVGAGFAVAALCLAFVRVDRAAANAAFSRAIKTECTTCHTIFPQLNEFGQAFEKNGFVWPGGVPKSKKVKVVQTEEERKSAEFINLSGIPAVLPLSVSLAVSYRYNDKAEDHLDQKFYSAQLLAAGAFGGDRIGFWFSESLGNQDTTANRSLTGPSQLWLVARQPLGVPVQLKAGRFSPDLSLWKATLNGRLLSMAASVDGFSVSAAQSGLELSTILWSRIQAVAGVNDRNNATGKDADGKDAAPHSVNDVYGRIGVKFGGADYHGIEPDLDLDKDSIWDYLSVSFSAFGYSGSTSKADKVDHDLTRFGVEAEASYRKALLMLGATFGKNNAEAEDPLNSTALSAEVDYVFNPKFALALRYDALDVDGKDRRTVITPGIVYAPLQSFKLRLNAAIDSTPGNAAAGKAGKNTTATLAATLHF